MDGRLNDLSQKTDNLEYSSSRLINLNTKREKENFPSQPYQNLKGIHKGEAQKEENSMVRTVKVVMVDQPTFKPKHDKGLLEPSEKLANLFHWTRTKEMQPLLNAVEIQRHAKEEPPKLILNPLPPKMKYAYRILKHRGYPAEPQHERKRFCREIFTLDKWTSMIAYGGADQGAPTRPEQTEQPEEPVEPPTDTQPPAPAVAPSEPPPEIPSSAPEITHTKPLTPFLTSLNHQSP
ncbi:hypothetical protein VitviT2T_019881 [Vitis vinifera]|uniref:Uncharacterized protein n=1 Tax=Vitis vinifera TaxID=29760 RepID=A0ABY9D2B4_VITVI|nr:hypothetical protein VitviT2T_019881 [Vitis vinifera]